MAEPVSMMVPLVTGERIHYLDWRAVHDEPAADAPPAWPLLLLLHGITATAWSWAPVARRLADEAGVLAMDLRGHGLSEAPRTGYDLESLAWDALTVLSGAGYGADVGGPTAVIAGHGLGGMVAATMARIRPDSIAGLALVDGGWEDIAESARLSPAELVASTSEPPEVLASMDAFLADRAAFDPLTWDADQEVAARSQVEQKHAGHLALVTRPAIVGAIVQRMFEYAPVEVLGPLATPMVVLVAEPGGADDEEARERRLALADVVRARDVAGGETRVVTLSGVGHNLMRYRPDAVASELRQLMRASGAPRDARGGPPRTTL